MIGETVGKLRKAKGMTQLQLARAAHVTQGYIALLEAGDRSNPSLAVVARIAAALGVNVTRLFEAERRRKR